MAQTTTAGLLQYSPRIRNQICSDLLPPGLLPLASTCHQLHRKTLSCYMLVASSPSSHCTDPATSDFGRTGSHDIYRAVLRWIIKISPQARVSFHCAFFILPCPAEYQLGAKAVRRAIKVLRKRVDLMNSKSNTICLSIIIFIRTSEDLGLTRCRFVVFGIHCEV